MSSPMELFLIQDEAKSSWRFAMTADVVKFFFREHKKLRCQARATTTYNKLCGHTLVKNRKLIEKHLQSIHTMAIPSGDFNRVVLTLSDIALCNRVGHKGLVKVQEVRNDWCKKLRSSCTLGSQENNGTAIECHAEWDQHGTSKCWMNGTSDQSPKLHQPITLGPLQPAGIDRNNQESQHDVGEYSEQQPVYSDGEEDKKSLGSFGGPHARLDNSNIPKMPEFPPHGQPRYANSKGEHTSQVLPSVIHPTQDFTTPKKHRQRPELYRSDYYTLPISETFHLGENPWAQSSLDSPDAGSSPGSSDVTSSPLSAYPFPSTIFDEPTAYSTIQDTPPTELNETSRMWDAPPSRHFNDGQSPSLQRWQTGVTPLIYREDAANKTSPPTGFGIDEDSNFEICDGNRVWSNNYKDVSKLLFKRSDPRKNGHDPFLDANLLGAVKRAQTLPIHILKDRTPKWIQRRPERRCSIHELPARQVLRSALTSDEPAVRVFRQRHRRDSLPLNISSEDVLLRFHNADDGAFAEKAELQTYNNEVDSEDDYDEEEIEITDDHKIVGTTTTTHTSCIQTGSSPTKLKPSYPVFERFQLSKNPLRELCIEMRDAINNEKVSRPGYIYCYEHRNQPGHIKIGHVRIPEDRYERDLATCTNLLHQSALESKATQSPTPPHSVITRLKKWNHCGYDIHLLYWSSVVYGAWKIEKLVHGQLAEYREKVVKCEGCNRKHVEWFQVDLQTAKNAVDMWCQFAGLRPYDCGMLKMPWQKISFPGCGFKSTITVETLSGFLDCMGLYLESEKTTMNNEANSG
ncbi:hypothetical protein PFICI_08238 [Pestalotiopsis fici W106-1]|uniref:Bacteriophage T5 Orf172 DNA-binding domain-containing protein n=1 Tax=Pestalotiopsis fici (strain W106-1 / CGMCC3.15140) TaxID=1229662 RepID=W3X3X7_PESFW|nr:uncharacterized protein PFICI_08238 [Pestalotiopsis fici W106-1]ETS80709.1 hypothetical protein PFICI_08238 [Pestalotiopsis fici W106-1]